LIWGFHPRWEGSDRRYRFFREEGTEEVSWGLENR